MKLPPETDEITSTSSRSEREAPPLAHAAVRLGLRQYIGQFVSAPQTAALFFTLAFGMIVRWRAEMLRAYRKLQHQELIDTATE